MKNVWEAIYELGTDRIGHGLTLADQAELVERARDRRIAIELCPSSNDQIIGYRDARLAQDTEWPDYPLRRYLKDGVRATINTDNPGISRTTLSREYLKASRMTPGGLTKWELLQLVRNGFRAAFCDFASRRSLLLEADEAVAGGMKGVS